MCVSTGCSRCPGAVLQYWSYYPIVYLLHGLTNLDDVWGKMEGGVGGDKEGNNTKVTNLGHEGPNPGLKDEH